LQLKKITSFRSEVYYLRSSRKQKVEILGSWGEDEVKEKNHAKARKPLYYDSKFA